MDRQYIAIDLKSFYASVECNERGLDPLTTNLVVADQTRTEKTICLAVSPSLKTFGIPGRPRLFEVIQKIGQINHERKWKTPGNTLSGESNDINELKKYPEKAVSFIIAQPRMAYYIEYSTLIYGVYLKYIAPEDILVYSIDEVFIDATNYLKTYNTTAHKLAMTMIRDVLETTGITATAGIGTNMYLCKIAMDIVAKKMPADKDGVRIAELDEMSYREMLWDHKPLTSFWRVGKGYSAKLEAHGMYTMGDIARMSLSQYGEDLLYKLFGVNAELLIDHAWGWEPCTIADIKSYKPQNNSISSGQVLHEPYTYEKARMIIREMVNALALDLVDKRLVTDQIVLTVGYDAVNLKDPNITGIYSGNVATDHYGRRIPKHAHGTANIDSYTSSEKLMLNAVLKLYSLIVDKNLLIRRLNITANHVVAEATANTEQKPEQLEFSMIDEESLRQKEKQKAELEKERRKQEAVLDIKRRFGKNAILTGTSLEDGSTAKERNNQIGGHKA